MREIWNSFSRSNKVLGGVLLLILLVHAGGHFYVDNLNHIMTIKSVKENEKISKNQETIETLLREKLSSGKYASEDELHKKVKSELDSIKSQFGDYVLSLDYTYTPDPSGGNMGILKVVYKGKADVGGEYNFYAVIES